jgi:ABC-type multidrug transport system ATPase subunit
MDVSKNPVILSIENLSIYYGKFNAVMGCNFFIREREIFGFLGPNGAGKSSVIKAISRQIPYQGKIYFWATEISDLPREHLNSSIGVVPQDPCFFKDFTVIENLRLAAKFHDVIDVEGAVGATMSQFMLSKFADKPAKNLSGGYRRLLSIAMSTIHNPKILIMDEPTVGLDPDMRADVWELIKELRDSGMTIMLTTHYLDEAEALCDRIVILDNGKVRASAPPSTLIDQYGGNTIIVVVTDKDASKLSSAISRIPNVLNSYINGRAIRLECQNRNAVQIIRDLSLILGAPPHNIKPLESLVREPTLADAFKNIVKKEMEL